MVIGPYCCNHVQCTCIHTSVLQPQDVINSQCHFNRPHTVAGNIIFQMSKLNNVKSACLSHNI